MPSTTELRWEFDAEEHRVEEHLGRESLYLRGGTAIAHDVRLEHGVFEFDVAFPDERDFHGGLFRARGHRDHECFFVRPHQSGNPDATQYTPVYNGVMAWQLYHGEPFQMPLRLPCDEWLHIRLAFAGARVEIAVGAEPPFAVDLKRDLVAGGIGVMGGGFVGAHFSGFSWEELPPEPAPPSAAAAPGVITSWDVSDVLTGGSWTRLDAESSGLTNLAKVKGLEDGDTVYARAFVDSAKEQSKRLDFGFSDRVRVYLNGSLLFSADDSYRSRDYRFLGSIGWFDSLWLPLEEGRNELVFAVSEEFGGWGLQARFPDPV